MPDKHEVEIRFRLGANRDAILGALAKLSWQPTEKREVDTYFCEQQLVASGQSAAAPYIIRIRNSSQDSVLAYKSFREKGSWIELETGISNAEAMEQILNYLSHVQYLRIKKHRLTGRIDTIEINLDEIDDLGSFIEMELVSTNVETARNELISFAKKIGVAENDIEQRGYVQLMEERIKSTKASPA
jgi:adenylate cyclase class 2